MPSMEADSVGHNTQEKKHGFEKVCVAKRSLQNPVNIEKIWPRGMTKLAKTMGEQQNSSIFLNKFGHYCLVFSWCRFLCPFLVWFEVIQCPSASIRVFYCFSFTFFSESGREIEEELARSGRKLVSRTLSCLSDNFHCFKLFMAKKHQITCKKK